MPDRSLLPESRILESLPDLPGWEYTDQKLRREFVFVDFVTAFAFMTACAIHAEATDHHPNWSNVYNRVTIELWTHDAGGVTGLDLDMARRIMEVAGRIRPQES